MKEIKIKIVAFTFVVGLGFTLAFVLTMGDRFATALFPTIALLSCFIVTGFLVGYFSRGVTFVEPGIGAVLLAICLYFIIPALNLKGFTGVWTSDWIIIYMNAVLLTFAGTWLGEMFEDASLMSEHLLTKTFDWAWMIAGTLMGITITMIFVNFLDFLLGHNPSRFFIPYLASLLVTGLVVGWKSPGYTVLEAGLAGFLTVTAIFNIARLTLVTESEIDIIYIAVGIPLAFVVSVIGGFIGEKIQSTKRKKV